MTGPRLAIAAAFFIAISAGTAFCDILALGDSRYEGTLNGIKGGKVSITIRGTERQYDLSQITEIALDEAPKLADAEAARAGDAKKAAALYKQLIPTINKPELKLLVEWRTIDPTDRDARWNEAVVLFLDVYQSSPTDAVWNGRPLHWPGAGSSMFDDGARRVTATIKETKSDDVKKNLRKYLLDIYTKAGNIAEAQRVAREIDTGIAEESVLVAPAPIAPSDATSPALSEISAAITARNFAAALKQSDARLTTATGEAAAQLLALKAQAQEGQNNLKEAAGTWLRIFAHYPASPSAPGALLNAARLEKKLNDPAGEKILLDEILQKYPTSKEAALAPRE